MATLVTIVVIYCAVAAWVTLNQRRFIYFPDTHRASPAALGLKMLRPVTIRTTDGETIVGWWKPPARPDSGVVLYLHGNGGNLADRSTRFEKLEAHEFGLLAIDWRGYGGSTGKPSETGLDRDAVAAFDWARRSAPDSRVALFGESLGTGVSVELATHRPVAGLVLDSPYASVTRLAERQFAWLPVSLLITDRFDAEAKIGRVHAPLMILQCDRDAIIPVEQTRRLFKAANQPKELWVLPGCGHIETLKQHGAAEVAMYRNLGSWLAAPGR